MTFNHLFRSFRKCILFFAMLHVCISLIAFVVTADYGYLNSFNVIGLSIFFPSLGEGVVNLTASAIFVFIVFILSLLYEIRTEKK